MSYNKIGIKVFRAANEYYVRSWVIFMHMYQNCVEEAVSSLPFAVQMGDYDGTAERYAMWPV